MRQALWVPRGWAALAVYVAATCCLPSTNSQVSRLDVVERATADPTGCQCRTLDSEVWSDNSTCFLESCTLNLWNAPSKLSLGSLRAWLPPNVTQAENLPLLFTDVTLVVPSCAPVWALQAEACTFRVSASWPNAGLQAGHGFLFFPFLTSSSSDGATAQRLNVTCPLADWAALEASAPLLPCGTATVTTGAQLQTALTDLQARNARVLITLASNISLPAAPVAGVNGAPGSGNGSVSEPWARVYRNVTLVGLGVPVSAVSIGVSGGGGGGAVAQRQPTELNLSGRRNAFGLQQPAATAAASGGSGGGGGGNRVVMTIADMAIVNAPAGPRSTWPIGLLSSGMWHVDMDRRKGAPVQLVHLRISLILSLGQTRYFSYWYNRANSLVDEERESAAWILDVVTLTGPYQGGPTQLGLTGSYIEKYNTSSTAVPLLTPPSPPPVDLWSLDDVPVSPSSVGFVSSEAELLHELNGPWTGPRVIVVLSDITLNESTWPKDPIQLAAPITLAGPALATPSRPPPSLDSCGLRLARPPPEQTISFRNLRVFNASVPIAWALAEAPQSLPGLPAYEPWRTRCLPGPMDVSETKYEMHGCQVEVPPVVFVLLQIYNNLPCAAAGADAAAAWNCTNASDSATAAAAARFPYLPSQMTGFFDRIFRASGKFVVTQPDSDTILFRGNTLTSLEMNTTTFHLIRDTAAVGSTAAAAGSSSSSYSPPPSPAAAAANASQSRGSGAASAAAGSLPTSCNLQSLLVILMSAPTSSPALTVRSTAAPTHGSGTARGAVIGGIVAGGVVAGVGAIVLALFFVRRSGQRRRRKAQQQYEADVEKDATPDTPMPPSAAPSVGTGGDGATAGVSGKASSVSNTAVARKASGWLAAAAGGRGPAAVSDHGRDGDSGGCDGPGAATAGALPAGHIPAIKVQLNEVGGPARSDGDGDDGAGGCSAFSQSFAAGDPAGGKAPTMLEELLCKAADPGLRGGMMAAAIHAGVGAGAAGAAMAGRHQVAGGTAGGPRPLPGLDAANNGDLNNNCQAVNGANASSRGATPGGGSLSENVQRALAGEIDGMIRRFEETSGHQSGPHSSQGSIRQRVLGSGGFGVVYRGEWRGLPVAIKVVLLQDGDSAVRRERLVREVALSATLSHPNVVPTYHYTVQPVGAHGGGSFGVPGGGRQRNRAPAPDAGAAGAAAAAGDHDGGVMAYKLSIFMAYCDRGTLRDALREGVFRRPWPPLPPLQQPSPLQHQHLQPQPQQQQSVLLGAAPRRPPLHDGGDCGGCGGREGLPTAGSGGAASNASGDGGSGAVEAVAAAAPPPQIAVPHSLQDPPSRASLPQGHRDAVQRLLQRAMLPPAIMPGTSEPVAAEAGGDAVPLPLAATEVATVAPPAESVSPRPLRPPVGASGGRMEGRLETWQDLRAAPNQALALFAALDVARGLDYLHSCNVVHGDLSLQNILLTTTEPFFTDAAINAAAAAAVGFSGGSPAGGSAAGAAVGGAARATQPGAMESLPEEALGATAAGGGAARACGTVAPCCSPADSGAVEQPDAGPAAAAPPPPPALVGVRPASPRPAAAGGPAPPPPAAAQRLRPAVTARPVYGGGATTSSGASGTADAGLTEETEFLGGTVSTCTQSETLDPVSVSTEDASAGGGGAGGRVLSLGRRLTLVQPLLAQVFKISDFGLSVRLEGDETHRSGLHQGTPYYTATEVLVSGKVSPAADIYSYGVCLWCLAHGVTLCQLRHLLPPIFTPVAPTLMAHLAPELHPGLRGLVRRCLAGDPARRPTAGTMVSELLQLVQAVCGPDLAPLLLGAERRERDAGRIVASSLMMDSGAEEGWRGTAAWREEERKGARNGGPGPAGPPGPRPAARGE